MRSREEIRHFIYLYLTNGHKKANAYRDAFGKQAWQKDSLHVAGSRLFKAPTTQKIYKKIMENKILTAGEVLGKLSDLASNEDPRIQLGALKLVGDYHKLFTQKVEVSNPEAFQEIWDKIRALEVESQVLEKEAGSSSLDMNPTPSSGSSIIPQPDLSPYLGDQVSENLSPQREKLNRMH